MLKRGSRWLLPLLLMSALLMMGASGNGCGSSGGGGSGGGGGGGGSSLGGGSNIGSGAAHEHATKTQTAPDLTAGQQEALQSAKSYLELGGISKAGLIEQLSSSAGEGFPKADATYAAAHVGADWNAEAVESAKSYLKLGGMSKSGLIEQLSSSVGEQFTLPQAQYGADKAYGSG